MSSSFVRIEAYRHQHFSEKRAAPTLLPWLHSYYTGLLTPYGMEASLERLGGGKNNDFLSMGKQVLGALKNESSLNDIEIFLMAHRTFDTYYPFQSTTTLLCREFGIEAPAMALTEQELTAPYMGLKILLAALNGKRFSGSGLLLVLDQATLPYEAPWYTPDCVDTALVIKLSVAQDSRGASIDGRHYWVEKAHDRKSWPIQCIHSYLDAQRTNLEDVTIVADEALGDVLTSHMQNAQLRVTERKWMSCAGLLAALDVLEQGRCALLTHMAADGHMYLFLLRPSESSAAHVTGASL